MGASTQLERALQLAAAQTNPLVFVPSSFQRELVTPADLYRTFQSGETFCRLAVWLTVLASSGWMPAEALKRTSMGRHRIQTPRPDDLSPPTQR